ncbi:MAG: 2-phospho-L-lactate guanylyltransferase [Thermomicrobiales bacterium]|nr:2-phospho-L-lactate guanylyltransferase [Thermomicrobiales bacterium]
MSGGAIVIVPVRSFTGGKTRLADAIAPQARARLTRRLLDRVLGQIERSGVAATTLVVSPDPIVLAEVADRGPAVEGVRQPAALPGLNAAVTLGREAAAARGADAALTLFADLPLLTPADLVALAASPDPVTIVPDRHGRGTNGLLLRLDGPARRFRFAFGPDSADRHAAEARRLGLDAAILAIPGISFDLDTPEDWRALLATQPGPDWTAATMVGGCGERR